MSYYNYNNHHNHQSGYPQDYNNDGRIDFKGEFKLKNTRIF